MKIYVAGRFSDKKNIKSKMMELEKLGCTITHDWTTYKNPNMSVRAQKDVTGVMECDLLLVIMDTVDYPYRGSFTEIGVALGAKKDILIYTPHKKISAMTNCFYYHPSIKHISDWDQCKDIVYKVQLTI